MPAVIPEAVPAIVPVPNSPIGWTDPDAQLTQPKQSRYCQPWDSTPNGVCKTARFQLEFFKVGFELLAGRGLESYLSGICDTAGVNQLIDTTAAFATPPVVISSYVVNTDTGTFAIINSIAGPTALNIGSDIFTVAEVGDGYSLVDIRSIIGSTTPDGAGSVTFAPDTGANAFQIYDAYPNTTNRFVVEVDITNYAGGELVVQHGDGVAPFESLDPAYTATSNGTHSFYGIPSVGTRLRIVDATEEASYTITGIRIYYIARPEVYVYDGETEIAQLDPTVYTHNYATFEISPCDYGNGCYQLYANNVNGLIGRVNFPVQTNLPWALTNTGTGWAFVANELVHTAGGAAGTNLAEYIFTAVLSQYCNYVIYFKLDGALDKPGVFLKLVDNSYVDVSDYIAGTAGPNYYVSFSGYSVVSVEFRATEVDSVTIEQFNVYDTYYNEVGGYFTPSVNEEVSVFRIAPQFCVPSAGLCVEDLGTDYIWFESTITNDSVEEVKKKGRWLAASSTYSEGLYLQSNVRFARYQDDDFETYRDSNGRGRLVYSDRVKVQECQIAPVPVWVHDWMSWAARNTFEVNGVEYYLIDGSYSPNWQRDSPNASAVFEIAKQDQDIKTTGCD